jgi:hypothetical protein
VATAMATADALLNAFTLSRIFCATLLSLISCRPVPSTSQTPACAMFHSPVAPDPTNRVGTLRVILQSKHTFS